MSAEKVGKRYAKALFNEAVSAGSLDAIYADYYPVEKIHHKKKERYRYKPKRIGTYYKKIQAKNLN